MNRLFYIIILVLMTSSCGTIQKSTNTISVSIEPIRYIVEQIAGDDFKVNVVVPDGSSAESYEPTPSVLREVARSQAFISVGLLETELNIINFIESRPEVINCELYKNVILVEDSCEGHGHAHGGDCDHDLPTGDPHIWLSPGSLQSIADETLRVLVMLNGDSTAKYTQNYNALSEKIDSLHAYINSKRELLEGITVLVYHPLLGYMSSEYGFTQLAIEKDGKEPSAKHLKELITTAKDKNIKTVFYQSQFPISSVTSISKELGAATVELNPLSYDVIDNIRHIVDSITNGK